MKECKAPDVKGPRYRAEVYNVLNKEFYNNFRKRYPKYKSLDNVTLRNIIKQYNETIYNTVIETRDGVQLPESIGWIFIGTCQQSKKRNIDFAKSQKYGVTVVNQNWDSDGKLAKIFFTSYALKHKMRNREFWSFVACRNFKRKVAKTYPENWNMYVAVDPTKKINMNYSKAYYKDIKAKETTIALKNYNEFDL
jgi:hypothetical protein